MKDLRLLNTSCLVMTRLLVVGVALVSVFKNEAHAFGGSSKPISQIVGEMKSLKEIPVTSPQLADVKFLSSEKLDYNNDGVLDRLVCNGSEVTVTVFDGKKPQARLYHWAGPSVRQLSDGSKRIITNCDVVQLQRGYSSIIISMAFVHPRDGVRVKSNQFVIHATADAVRVKEVLVQDAAYLVASRSVKCAPYPKKLVDAGYKPGALCFYAGYDTDLARGGRGTNTALLKIEETAKGDLVFKDLSPKSGLMWNGGVNGTSKGSFTVRSKKYDGLHMMDSVFMDQNKDGLVDLITFGQHASVYAWQMVLDKTRPEGLRFDREYITRAGSSEMTEYLTADTFGENDASLAGVRCYIATGEDDYGARGTPTHFRCFKNNQWVKYVFPGSKIFSWYNRPVIKNNGKGKVIIKLKDVKQVNGENVGTDRYFSLDLSEVQ